MSMARFYPRPGAAVRCQLGRECQAAVSHSYDGALCCEEHFAAAVRRELLGERAITFMPVVPILDGALGFVRFTILTATPRLQTERLLSLCTVYAGRARIALRWPDGRRAEVWP
jgi:hypothetical protein